MDKLTNSIFYNFADNHEDCQQSFKCPISLTLMTKPYILSDGHTYDKVSIESMTRVSGDFGISPLSRQQVSLIDIQPNYNLISLLDDWLNKIYTEFSGSTTQIENKIEDKIDDNVTIPHSSIHLVLVIDISGSMNCDCDLEKTEAERKFTRLDIVKHSINTVLAVLDSGDFLTLITFSSTSQVIFSGECIESNKKMLNQKVIKLSSIGSTNLASGMKVAYDEIKKINHENAKILVLTDGEIDSGNDHILNVFLKSNDLKNIPVTTVGISNESKSGFLCNLAKDLHSYFIYINDASTVATSFANFIANLFVVKEQKIDEEAESYEIFRLKYIDVLKKFCFLSASREYLNISSDNIITNFFKEVKMYIDQNPNDKHLLFFQELYKDYLNENGDDGEVKLAITDLSSFLKWGNHYLLSLYSAHLNKTCTNFKDKSTQYYFSSDHEKVSSSVLNIFISIPPIIPSGSFNYNNNNNNDRYNRSRSVNYNNNTNYNSSLNMSRYIDVSNGCFTGDSEVLLSDMSTKKISELTGDEILNNNFSIKYIVKMKMETKLFISEINNVKVTCYHPMEYENKWIFPIDHPSSKQITLDSNYLYNIVLNEGYFITINGMKFVSLGHNLNNFDEKNQILSHSFFGTNEVVRNIEEFKLSNEKIVLLENFMVERCASTGLVNGYKKK